MSSSRKEEAEAAAKKPKGSHPPEVSYGLYNQGSTCYLNCILQVLYMTKEFRDRLYQKPSSADKELRRIFDKMKMGTCETQSITQWLDIKNVNQQRDAAECLEMILNKISPQASKVFQGELMYVTKCVPDGDIINSETNPFWSLPLSLKDNQESTFLVEENFKKLFETTTFGQDSLVYCNECHGNKEANSECEMVHSPQILTLLLKRFDFNYSTKSYSKSSRSVDVPLVLDIKNKRYRLYAIVNHEGTLEGGHYTSTVLSSEDNTWYKFDDTRVKKYEKPPLGTNKTFNSSNAYLIMYRASESLKETVKETVKEMVKDRRDEHQDDLKGCREEHKRRHRESDNLAHEKSRHQESPVRKDRNREAPGYNWLGEGGDLGHEKRVSSLKRVQDDLPFADKKHSNTYLSRQHEEDRKMKQRSKMTQDENQPSKCSRDILKNPILIAVAVVTCMIIGIIIVVLVV